MAYTGDQQGGPGSDTGDGDAPAPRFLRPPTTGIPHGREGSPACSLNLLTSRWTGGWQQLGQLKRIEGPMHV